MASTTALPDDFYEGQIESEFQLNRTHMRKMLGGPYVNSAEVYSVSIAAACAELEYPPARYRSRIVVRIRAVYWSRKPGDKTSRSTFGSGYCAALTSDVSYQLRLAGILHALKTRKPNC